MGTLNISAMVNNEDNLPVLTLSASKNLTTTTASARTTVPAGGQFLRLVADENMYIKLGDGTSAAAAGDMLLVANLPEYVPVNGLTHIAAIDVA